MAPGDLGRVIGRQGRTAAALRTLVARRRSSRAPRRRSSSAIATETGWLRPRRALSRSDWRPERMTIWCSSGGSRGPRQSRAGDRQPRDRFPGGAVHGRARCCWSAAGATRAATIRDGPVSPGPADRRARRHRDDERRRGAGRRRAEGAGGGAAPLPEGTFYHHDLVGCEVRDTAGGRSDAVTAVEGTLETQPAGRRRGARRGADSAGRRTICAAIDVAAPADRRRSAGGAARAERAQRPERRDTP